MSAVAASQGFRAAVPDLTCRLLEDNLTFLQQAGLVTIAHRGR